MEFKVGDKVKIIKSNTISKKDLNLMGKIVNYYGGSYTVKFDKQYSFTHNCCGKYEENLYRRYNDYNLELIKENTMKAGDTVTILVGKYKGQTGIVVRNGTYTYVEIDNKTICYRNDSVKIIEPKTELKKEHKFKIGDRVKIIKRTFFCGEDRDKDLGLMGEIVDFGTSVYDYVVKFDKEYSFTHTGGIYKENLYRWYREDELELVKEPKTELKTELKKDYKFKIGDKVRIIESNTAGKDKNKDLNLISEIIDYYGNSYIVKFDKEYDFTHNFGYGKRLYRWYKSDNLELIIDPFATGNFILIDLDWGVIVDDKIVYENGKYDYVKYFNNKDFASSLGKKVIAILNNCTCFNNAKVSYSENKNIIYKFFDREKWINEHYQKAISDTNVAFTCGKNKDMLCTDKVNYKIYVAKCSNNDTYNTKTGIAISYVRYLGEEIPKEI